MASFLQLPRELRDKIYEHLLDEEQQPSGWSDRFLGVQTSRRPCRDLLLINKQSNHEIMDLTFRNASIRLNVSDANFTPRCDGDWKYFMPCNLISLTNHSHARHVRRLHLDILICAGDLYVYNETPVHGRQCFVLLPENCKDQLGELIGAMEDLEILTLGVQCFSWMASPWNCCEENVSASQYPFIVQQLRSLVSYVRTCSDRTPTVKVVFKGVKPSIHNALQLVQDPTRFDRFVTKLRDKIEFGGWVFKELTPAPSEHLNIVNSEKYPRLFTEESPEGGWQAGRHVPILVA